MKLLVDMKYGFLLRVWSEIYVWDLFFNVIFVIDLFEGCRRGVGKKLFISLRIEILLCCMFICNFRVVNFSDILNLK